MHMASTDLFLIPKYFPSMVGQASRCGTLQQKADLYFPKAGMANPQDCP